MSRYLPLVVLVATACAARPAPATDPVPISEPPVATESPEPEPPAESEPESKGRAILHTTEGAISVTFFPGVAPRTVEHIEQLMKAGCYSGVDLFRLEPGFVVQVAPVSNAECHPAAMSTVPGEFSKVPHQRLYLSMARWEDADSGTSSWSIMLGPAPSMDGQYTVFGRVVDGEDTIRKIEAMSSTKGDDGMRRLDRKVTIERVEIVEETGVSSGGGDAG